MTRVVIEGEGWAAGALREQMGADAEGRAILIPPTSAFWGDYLAADVWSIAGPLIEATPELQWLQKYRIRFLWRRKASKRAGKAVLGKCQLASGLLGFFADCDFIITLAADMARGKPARWLEALIHHELLHADFEEKEGEEGDEPEIVLRVKGHDFEGFTAEVERYGLWTDDLVIAESAFRQLALPLDEGRP